MSNLVQRLLAAAIGIPVLLLAANYGGYWLMALIGALQLLLLHEWRGFATAAGVPLGTAALLFALLGVDLFIFGHGAKTATGETLIAVYVWVLLVVFQRERRPLLQLGYGALYLIYAALPIALWYHLAEYSDAIRHSRLGALGILFAATWLCDSGAYFGGRLLGRHKLYPQASPNKTVEGAVSGLLFAALLLPALQMLNLARPLPYDYWILPLIVGIAGQIGDLIESLMKREAGIKDSSQIIPGHGGFLDRFDSLLVSSPLFLAYLFLSTP